MVSKYYEKVVEWIHEEFKKIGHVPTPVERASSDDPKIVECWI